MQFPISLFSKAGKIRHHHLAFTHLSISPTINFSKLVVEFLSLSIFIRLWGDNNMGKTKLLFYYHIVWSFWQISCLEGFELVSTEGKTRYQRDLTCESFLAPQHQSGYRFKIVMTLKFNHFLKIWLFWVCMQFLSVWRTYPPWGHPMIG